MFITWKSYSGFLGANSGFLGANSGVFAGAWISFKKNNDTSQNHGRCLDPIRENNDDTSQNSAQDYPALPRTTQELVIPVALSIGDSCTKHYDQNATFRPVMISIAAL